MSKEVNRETEAYEMDEEIAVKEHLNPRGDSPSKVKFTSATDGKNGEAKVDVENGYNTSVGMSKEELMKYANEPFWVRLRMFLFILFWLIWLAMLLGAILIIAFAPKCPATSSLSWWQKTTVYQVYVRSFKDSNGDGEGDIRGLIDKLTYFKDIGVETLILSPIYPSPMKDSGYDVSDYTDIDPRYGTLEDFEELVKQLHNEQMNMKVIIDFIPNHTSDLHPWFQASLRNETEFADYYVWREANETSGTRSPPNNWKSVFGGSAWTWSEQRNKYYLHQFLDKQPDLNLRNPDVKKSLEEVLRFWLKKKVDGIRIDAASHLFEDENFEDEKEISVNSGAVNDYNTLEHDKTKSQPENYELLKEWRKVVKAAGLKKIIISEAYETTENLLKYYGNSKEPIIDLPFNFKLVEMNTNAGKLKEEIQSWIDATESLNWAKDAKPPGPWSAWVTGNHDKPRIVSRLGNRRLADALLMVTFLIPRNTPVIYYGDEIGLEDQPVIPDKAKSEGDSSRFAYRSPMQWNANTTSAGFSDNETTNPWLYVQSSHTTFNVESENNVNTSSHLKVFKSLVKLRQEQAETILLGETKFPTLDTNEVFVMTRVSKGYNGYLLAINFNTSSANKVKLDETYLPTEGKIFLTDSVSSIDLLGTQIKLSELQLQPSQSILIELEAQTD